VWVLLLIGSIIIEVGLTCLIPHSKGYFFNLIEAHNSTLIWIGLAYYFGNIFVLELFQTFKPYSIIRYALERRLKLTTTFNSIPPTYTSISNFAQRIQEDIKLYLQNSISVYTEYAISGLIVVYLLITHHTEYILIGSAILYSLLFVAIAYLFKPRLVKTEKTMQQNEAQFRLDINNLGFGLLPEVLLSNKKAANVRLSYGIFNKTQTAIMLALPYIVLLPFYLKSTITLGYLMEIATVFDLLVLNMAIIINLFPFLAQAKASKERIDELNHK